MKTNELTPARYYGETCHEHPELKGLRLKRNWLCVECVRAQKRRRRRDPARGKALREYEAQKQRERREK